MLRQSFLAVALMATFNTSAFTIETVHIAAPETGIKHQANIVLPDGYTTKKNYPVVYLLHGWSGNYEDWAKNTEVESLADRYNMIIVMPDGNYDSWYVDSKTKIKSNYATYIAKDVVNFVDDNYSTITSSEGRGITGLSMGGFGAMSIGLNNLDTFGAIGSMSGGMDITPFSANWGIPEVLGQYSDNKALWEDKAIINNLHKLATYNSKWVNNAKRIPIAFEVGVDDFFFGVNRELHEEMIRLNIKHDYTEREGAHNWDYWNNAISYQMQFFSDALHKDGVYTPAK